MKKQTAPLMRKYGELCRSINPAFVKTFTGLVESIEMCNAEIHYVSFIQMLS